MVKYGMNGVDFVEESFVCNVGLLLFDLFEYFQNEYLLYCLLINVLSGLGMLFVNYVYFNGSKILEMINLIFREGDMVLFGKEFYKNFLFYYII